MYMQSFSRLFQSKLKMDNIIYIYVFFFFYVFKDRFCRGEKRATKKSLFPFEVKEKYSLRAELDCNQFIPPQQHHKAEYF